MKNISSSFSQTPIPHNRPTLGEKEATAAAAVIQSGWVAQGKQVRLFENEFCTFLNLPESHAAAVSSGTAALYLALWALHSRAKKVAQPIYTCSALKNATAFAQARPVFIDSTQQTPNISFAKLTATKPELAIIPHMHGLPSSIPRTLSHTTIIEDCAQALGATTATTDVGLQGDIGVFSFYATKLITSGGQGGMLVSKNRNLIDTIKEFRDFDYKSDGKPRFNLQMTDMQAAVGRVQLTRLPNFLSRREEIFNQYLHAGLPLLNNDGTGKPIHFRALLHTEKPQQVIRDLASSNIIAQLPITVTKDLTSNQFPHAYSWATHLVSLPIYPTLTNQQVQKVIEATLRSM